jgi:hypothetical protein
MKNSLLSCEYVPDTQQHGGVCMLASFAGRKYAAYAKRQARFGKAHRCATV